MPSSHATAFAGASVEDPLARAKLAEAREERRRSRPSPLVLLAFIFSLLTLVYSAGVSIPLFIAGNDWQETFLDIPFDFRGIDRFVGEVSSSSPEAFRPATRMVRTLMYVPLGIPILLALFAVPGIVQRRRRGFATLVVVFCLISTEIILLSAASTPVQRTIDQYCRTYASAHGDAGALLAEAEENPNAITRLALLHRAAGSSFIEQGDQDAGAPLVRTALDSGRSTVERMIALSILGQNYREQLVDPNGFPSVSDWRLQFARIAEPDSRIRAELREGFVTVLRHVPAAELAPIFAIYIDQQYSPERYYALQWWLEVAPKETFERWIDALETNGCSPALRQLVANSPSRVRGTARGTRLHEVVEH